MSNDRNCGALGCRNEASVRTRTDQHGVLVLCNDHAHGQVVEYL